MRISVAMCTCDGAAHLEDQLRSLAGQERLPDELIIHDDASTDETPRIIERFASAAPFAVRFKIHPKRLGVTANFASAISTATGDIIACCDQDDVWYPDKLQRIADEYASEPNPPDLVFSDADLVDSELRPLGSRLWKSIGFCGGARRAAEQGRLWEVLIRFNAVSGAGMAFSSRWRDLLLPIPDGWMHDGWIGILLSILGRSRVIPRPLWAYRRHDAQRIGPGPFGWPRQIAAARRMDVFYFQHAADNFSALLERIGPRPVDPEIARVIQSKIQHCRARALIRTAGSPWPRLIAGELFSGRYQSCSLGWKSLAQDLVLG
ncbi:MAG TPA: glycosyltransferase family 2 protein [Tepidisphaeraceae bacterium]|nr:glycosyltransferase family 2 protein [Tepidisphaeraceae bacterium]